VFAEKKRFDGLIGDETGDVYCLPQMFETIIIPHSKFLPHDACLFPPFSSVENWTPKAGLLFCRYYLPTHNPSKGLYESNRVHPALTNIKTLRFLSSSIIFESLKGISSNWLSFGA
jgi:hypothetical protein